MQMGSGIRQEGKCVGDMGVSASSYIPSFGLT